MNEDACDFVDYERSESAEFILHRKMDDFKAGSLLIFDARLTPDRAKRVNYENMIVMNGVLLAMVVRISK